MHMNYGKNRSVHFVELHEKFYVHHESDGKRSIRLKEKWVVSAKGADFKAIGEHFGIDPVIARIMRNRGLTDLDDVMAVRARKSMVLNMVFTLNLEI